MRKTLMMSCIGLLSLGFVSCAHYQNEAAVLTLEGNHVAAKVEADIDYASIKKVEATVNTAFLFNVIPLHQNGNKFFSSVNRYRGLDKRQRQALYRAKQNFGVDIIIEPEFEVEKHCYFFGLYRTSTTKMKGWGANIKGFKKGE
ncbi:MAG: hypothetical protein J6034_10815 [Bacteroidaceae bacterium]|nr:hypothetical protein [Bacteroidaceae bacterium]